MQTKFIQWLSGAFEHTTKGASARKLTAFAFVFCSVWGELSWIRFSFQKDNFDLLPEILIINFTFILALFGIATWQMMKQSGNTSTQNPSENEKA
jgi:hypothetical protein